MIANFAGNAWTGLVGFAFIPIYLSYIGTEGYGLIGFFSMISAIMTVLDGGFGIAASRELARSQRPEHNTDSSQMSDLANLIRTLEYAFWGVAACLGLALVLLSPWIASHWLHVQKMTNADATDALRLMGIALILQWPSAYYRGCIIGLQKQLGLNAIGAAAATIKGAGAVLTLWLISPTIQAFFIWQIVAAFANVIALRQYLWRAMPPSPSPPRVNPQSVRSVGHFAAGVGATNVLSLALTQVDKILLSKLLPLGLFGYYTLAATMAALIYQFIGPVFNAYFPHLNQVVAKGNGADVALVYHRASQIMACFIVPVSLLMAFFARDLVWIWTGNLQLAHDLRWIIAFLAVGTMFNGIMTMPYALQLANAWTRLALWQNAIALCVLIPLIYICASQFGVAGAAAVWPLLNIGYVVVGAPIMYRRLLSGEKAHWYLYSVILPIGITGIFMGAAHVILDATGASMTRFALLISVSLVFLLALPLSAVVMPDIRDQLFSRLRKWKQAV